MHALKLFIMLTVMPSYLFAQSQHISQVPMEAYGKLPTKSMMVISPNGERFAYRETSNNRDLMVIRKLSDKSLVSAVDVSSVKPNKVYFVDNDILIFKVTSQNKKIFGYEGRHDISAAFAYNIKSKKIHQLLETGVGIHGGQSQLGQIMGISTDKKYAYMSAWGERSQKNLYKVSLERKRKPKLHRRGTDDTIDFFLDEKGEVIAHERYNNRSNIHRIEARIDDEWKEIFRQVTPIRLNGFTGLTPDHKSLVMRSQNKKTQRWAYYTMSLTNGEISDPLFSHEDKDVESVLTNVNRIVYGVRYSGFKPSYEFINENLNNLMQDINEKMTNYIFQIRDYTDDWRSILFYLDGKNSSGNYVLFQNNQLKSIASMRPDIPGSAVHPIEEYSFKARDGLTIPTLITTPKGVTAKNLPAIMLPHGGPESYDRIGFDWMTQYFANKGYLVIQPQFRGSRGFGPNHLFAGRGEWGRKMQDDLTDTVNDLVKKGMVDKSRVCIVGVSYGGYAALAGATFTPDLYKCVVSINGVSDIKLMLESEENTYGENHWVVSYWQDIISKGDVKEDHLNDISPINHVKNVNAPILLIHGNLDRTVPFEQSENIFDELEDANKNVTFIELKKGDHYLSSAKNRMDALKAIDKFIEKHL